MREFITAARKANEIMMLRSRHRGSFLIVEGSSDAKVFNNLVDSSNCKVTPAFSKETVIQVLTELEKRGAKGILAIVDSDFWVLEGKRINQPNLFVTDTHDLETMLLLSPALEKVLGEYIPGDKLSYLEKIGTKVRELLLDVGIQIGYLRWLNYKENLGLNFESLPISQIFDPQSRALDQKQILRAIKVASRSNNISISDDDLFRKIEGLKGSSPDPWHVCQGHDLVCILQVVFPLVLQEIVGREIAEEVRKKARVDELDRGLRLAYERSFFVTTRLFISIKEWEQNNPPFVVMAN